MEYVARWSAGPLNGGDRYRYCARGGRRSNHGEAEKTQIGDEWTRAWTRELDDGTERAQHTARE